MKEETAEERTARKAMKKQKMDKDEKPKVQKDGDAKSKEPKEKKTKQIEEKDGEEKTKKDKKRKAEDEGTGSSSSSSSSKPTKVAKVSSTAVEEEDEHPLQRRRTRSMSECEENYPAGQSAEDFRKEHQIQVIGTTETGTGQYLTPAPMTAFAMTPFTQLIRKALDSAGFPNPTPTQAQVWPVALQGRDVIAVAKTGSGKTCGFLLPAFHRMLTYLKDRKRGPPGILVLAPTRELACQIEEECIKFGRTSNIRSVCAYGGAPKSLQIRKIQNGIEVLIATPGRLNDLLEMKVVDLGHVVFLVLDEADRMLDMGFEPQIRTVIAKLPVDRQTMLV